MTGKDLYIAMQGIDPQFILDAAPDATGARPRASKSIFLRRAVIAVCACMLLGILLILPWRMRGGNVPALPAEDTENTPPSQTSSTEDMENTSPSQTFSDETEWTTQQPPSPPLYGADSPEKLTGPSLVFIVGNSASTDMGTSSAPPQFEFNCLCYLVRAKAVEVLPDTYQVLSVLRATSDVKPTNYRLVRMKTLESIRAKDMPEEFFYLMRESLVSDLTVYDSLIISMSQIWTENFILRNVDEQVMEALPLTVFGDPEDQPELGNMIAFTEGIFDESLWQNPGWRFGYQFADRYIEEPSKYYVAYRGCTESYTVGRIEEDLQAWRELEESRGETWSSDGPRVRDLDVKTQAAKEVLAYVRPFENGVFAQWMYGSTVYFRRYINGCETEEMITVNLNTEEVTYSEVRYEKEDLKGIGDVAAQIADMAEAYTAETPMPPHTDPEGKDLRCLNLFGWYAKVNGKIYGVIKTTWTYLEEYDRSGYPWYNIHYDDRYLLYDPEENAWSDVSRDDLKALLGLRNVYNGEYGVGEQLPME